MKKRLCFWGGICWRRKIPGVAWTISDNKVVFRHTKNLCLCLRTLLFEVNDDGESWVYRVMRQIEADDNNV